MLWTTLFLSDIKLADIIDENILKQNVVPVGYSPVKKLS